MSKRAITCIADAKARDYGDSNPTWTVTCGPMGNGEDDDGNGLVDDYHGYNFINDSSRLQNIAVPGNAFSGQLLHGSMCSAIVCGAGHSGSQHEFGLAPEGRWAGVVAGNKLEAAVPSLRWEGYREFENSWVADMGHAKELVKADERDLTLPMMTRSRKGSGVRV